HSLLCPAHAAPTLIPCPPLPPPRPTPRPSLFPYTTLFRSKPKEAATEFSKALQAGPRQPGPYVALGELYRKWDYTDEAIKVTSRSEEHTSELQSRENLVCRLLLEKKNRHLD